MTSLPVSAKAVVPYYIQSIFVASHVENLQHVAVEG
jgi:hypothetical protein